MDHFELYGSPANAVEVAWGRKNNGTHVVTLRFTYIHGPSNTSHQREMVRLGDLNDLIDDLTAIAEKAGIR